MPLLRIASAPATSPIAGGDGDAAEDRQHRIETPDLRGVGADIARHAEEHRVAERQQADIADQQIEGAGEQRDAQHLHDEERIGEERRDGDQREHQHDRRSRNRARSCWARSRRGGGDGAHVRRPCRTGPTGRMMSTIAMMTNTTVLEASG